METTPSVAQLDPVRFEVIRSALVEVTEEMGASLRRSAYSTNIKTRADFSCALFNSDLQLLAQNFGQPSHLGSMVLLVPEALRNYGVENLQPGDVICTNAPYPRGVHLNDITVIAPVAWDGEIVGYVANLAHHVDVGGGAPASVGAFRELYQEGVIIPPIKIVHEGVMDKDIFRLLLAQIRSKRETAGDFRAQLAANNAGIRRLSDLMARYGRAEIDQYTTELLRYTDARTRQELTKLPSGTYRGYGSLDFDGYSEEPVHLEVAITIDADGVLFDFTGCDAQRRAPVNATFTQTYSACTYVVKALIDPDVPANDGFYRAIRVQAPEGSVANCMSPSPVVGGHETQVRLVDVMLHALASELPRLVPAGTKAMQCHAGFGGIDPRSGDYYCFLETLAGGYGGRFGSDGPDAVQTHVQNTENAPVEETEQSYPVRILRYELLENSEGPGKYRGGLGLRRDYLFVDHEATFTILADRDVKGPHGLFGGEAAPPARYILNPDRDAKSLRSKTTIDVGPGDVVSYRTCGGGGYGPAVDRDPALVLEDVRNGKVSVDRARSVYKVVIDPHEELVDEPATWQLRQENSGGSGTGTVES